MHKMLKSKCELLSQLVELLLWCFNITAYSQVGILSRENHPSDNFIQKVGWIYIILWRLRYINEPHTHSTILYNHVIPYNEAFIPVLFSFAVWWLAFHA